MSEVPVASPSVIDQEKQYLFQNYSRFLIILTRGRGSYVYDSSGKRYLDLVAGIGVNALGHAHPRMMKVIRETSREDDPLLEPLLQRVSRAPSPNASPKSPAWTASSSATPAPKLWKARSRSSARTAARSRPRNSKPSRSTAPFTAARLDRSPSPARKTTAATLNLLPGARFVNRNDIGAWNKPSTRTPPASSSKSCRARAASTR